MYHVSAQGVDEHMINVHYYYYADHSATKRNLHKVYEVKQINAIS